MKLTIETCPWYMDAGRIEIRTYFDDGMRRFEITELIDKGFCKDKDLIKRMIDRQFYELKSQVYKHFATNREGGR